jgi:hypothetical protein
MIAATPPAEAWRAPVTAAPSSIAASARPLRRLVAGLVAPGLAWPSLARRPPSGRRPIFATDPLAICRRSRNNMCTVLSPAG